MEWTLTFLVLLLSSWLFFRRWQSQRAALSCGTAALSTAPGGTRDGAPDAPPTLPAAVAAGAAAPALAVDDQVAIMRHLATYDVSAHGHFTDIRSLPCAARVGTELCAAFVVQVSSAERVLRHLLP
jgi:hypothetical protein